MARSKTKSTGDQKKQFIVANSPEVDELVTRIANKYARAVVEAHPTDDKGRMDAGLGDCPLFTSALQALDERLDPKKPAEIVEFVDKFKKKRGPQVDSEEHVTPKLTPLRKLAVSATAADSDSSTKRDQVLSRN